jgi:hypothetical protein
MDSELNNLLVGGVNNTIIIVKKELQLSLAI